MPFKKLIVLATGAALATAFAAPVTFAQEEMKPAKQENAVYLSMVLVKYKGGMRRKAMEHIDKYFVPAGQKAGTPGPWTLHFDSGPWDAAYFWDHKGGYADLEWETSENDVKWMKALADLNGGQEAAMKLLDDYYGMIAKSTSEIGHHHQTPDEMKSAKK